MKSWKIVKDEALKYFGIRTITIGNSYYAVYVLEDRLLTMELGRLEDMSDKEFAESLTSFLRSWVYGDDDEKEVSLILKSLQSKLSTTRWSLTLCDYWAELIFDFSGSKMLENLYRERSRYIVPLSKQGILELCDFVNDLPSSGTMMDMTRYPLFLNAVK